MIQSFLWGMLGGLVVGIAGWMIRLRRHQVRCPLCGGKAEEVVTYRVEAPKYRCGNCGQQFS